jgi:dolichol-phosphate mannosyltransferase
MSTAAQFAGRLGAAARRPASWVQLFKFGLVGGSGYLINLAVFAVLDGSAGMNHVIAAICAFVVAVTNNFLWNRYWTFGPGEGPAHFQAARFFAVSLASLGLNLAILQLLVGQHMTGELTAQAIAVAAAMPFNFLGNKLWAFA